MMIKIKLILLTSVITAAQATNLRAPFTLPNAQVLPQGIRNVSYKGVLTTVGNQFNDQGKKASIAEPFFKEITFREVMKGKVDPNEKAPIRQAMDSVGASPEDSFGESTGSVNIEALANIPVFAFGVTKKWTMAVAVPVVKASFSFDTGIIQKNESLHQRTVNALTDKGAISEAEEFNRNLSDPIREKMKEYGYDMAFNDRATKIGDVRVISKYQLMNNPLNRLALVGELTLPTGDDQDVNRLVDLQSGDGQTDIGLGFNYDFFLNSKLMLTIGTIYTVQLADNNAERIPFQEGSRLSPDIDNTTRRNLGDFISSTVGATYTQGHFIFETGYTYQNKGRDKYSGLLYSPERYTFLEDETEQNLHSVQASISFNTIGLYKQKRFPIPLSLRIGHSMPIKGRNVIEDPLTSLDFSLFF